MNYLNVGCGNRIHKDWVNIDKVPTNQSVKQCDVENGLLFSDCSFDIVYHSHVLEHFAVNDANKFLAECYRVLKSKGIIRVAVPDLERIVLCYLQTLQRIGDRKISAIDDYDWIMLEMYDQVVRNYSGGKMADFLSRPTISNQDFVVKRCGIEVKDLIRQFEQQRKTINNQFVNKVSRFSLHTLFTHMNLNEFREKLIKILLGNEYRALQVGRFRCSGENHQWMYDKFSLGRMLDECGFVKIVQRDAKKSYIMNWSVFNLDTEPDGLVYKPDSLYMEAVKP